MSDIGIGWEVKLAGMSLAELSALKLKVFAAIRRERTKRKIPVKYRNPKNTKQAWAGRGLEPAWFRNLSERAKKQCLVA